MSDERITAELKQHRTQFPPHVREIETLQIRQVRQDISDVLDIVFVMDTTGSMEGDLASVAGALSGVAANIASEFPSIRYSVISFKDEGETIFETGADLVGLAACQTALDSLTAEGGGDIPENSYGALWEASRLDFRDYSTRVIVLVTGADSHERGKTFWQCKNALANSGAFLFSTYNNAAFSSLVSTTGGGILTGSDAPTLQSQITTVLLGLANPTAEPIWIVNDSRPFVATLENGLEKTFENRSFAINPFLSGESGSIEISLSIDNTDFEVSKFLAKAKVFQAPLEVTLRVYLSNDLTTPQNLPPTVLFATDFECSGSTISAKLSWIDLQNSPFPDEYYSPSRCPSLQ